ncbi:MAG TPA: histidinol-phosphate transaminase [Dehalococcoidia bacterium]|nr:histidinol-phosphate transaminase [Dehalococcoidia bacterium]
MSQVRELLVPHLRHLDTYQGVDPMEVLAEQAGIPLEQVVRLNGNENPYGPSPKVVKALGSFEHYNHYPDPGQRRMRHSLSGYLGVSPERIVCGNGSDELIDMLLRMFVGPGENILLPTPTFGMYAFNAEVVGGEAISIPRDENFEIDLEAVKLALNSKTKAIFLASPNNPTGNIATEVQIRALLDTGVIVVVDETYYEFCGQTVLPLLDQYPNLVVLRTFSKWAGLAGLRIGLGVMDPEIARTMMSMKPPYNVNLAAEIALLASLDDRPTLMERVRAIVMERDRMNVRLRAIPGIEPWPSRANFILCRLPEGRGKAIFEGLCRRGIFLRYFGSDRLKDYVRASVGLPNENDTMIQALTELVGG